MKINTDKWKTVPKPSPTEEQFEVMIAYLLKRLPLTRDDIIKRAVKKYHGFHVMRNSPGAYKHQTLVAQGYKCYFCGKYITEKTTTLDHLIPIYRNGDWSRENLAATCTQCNNDKGNMTEEEFVGWRKENNLPTTTPSTPTPTG